MSDQDNADKPHAATAKRRKDFRDDGKFARAKDAGAVTAVAAVAGVLALSHQSMGEALARFFRLCHGDLLAITRGDGASLMYHAPAPCCPSPPDRSSPQPWPGPSSVGRRPASGSTPRC